MVENEPNYLLLGMDELRARVLGIPLDAIASRRIMYAKLLKVESNLQGLLREVSELVILCKGLEEGESPDLRNNSDGS